MRVTDLTLSELEQHLWEAANMLRGPVDATDFKTYIFPLLFFKRISDVYDEELDTALEDSDGDMVFAVAPAAPLGTDRLARLAQRRLAYAGVLISLPDAGRGFGCPVCRNNAG